MGDHVLIHPIPEEGCPACIHAPQPQPDPTFEEMLAMARLRDPIPVPDEESYEVMNDSVTRGLLRLAEEDPDAYERKEQERLAKKEREREENTRYRAHLLNLPDPSPEELRHIAELTVELYGYEASISWWHKAAEAGDAQAIKEVLAVEISDIL